MERYTSSRFARGVKFQNGDGLTAEDVKFSIERYNGVFANTLKQKISSIEQYRDSESLPCPYYVA